jgi:hypothetical protein
MYIHFIKIILRAINVINLLFYEQFEEKNYVYFVILLIFVLIGCIMLPRYIRLLRYIYEFKISEVLKKPNLRQYSIVV